MNFSLVLTYGPLDCSDARIRVTDAHPIDTKRVRPRLKVGIRSGNGTVIERSNEGRSPVNNERRLGH